ncbi:MAG: hypothetical protein WBV95_16165 [Desulfobacterales bacterium]|jgi:hypothetical protein
MRSKYVVLLALVFVLAMPPLSTAGDFDGIQPLLCTVIDFTECIMDEGCHAVTPADVNLPRIFWIDVKNKIIKDKKEGEGSRRSPIRSVQRIDNKLIIQGAEEGREGIQNGFGWTIAIMEDTGRMVLTASGDLVGDVAFGVCTPR